jgi:AraC-like DNA-binding protein/mannose-6-phosphate isomerase-like protein (cupin superfamily)
MRRQHVEPREDTPPVADPLRSVEALRAEISRLRGVRLSGFAGDFPAHHALGRHHHGCGQLIFAASGVMKVDTDSGIWVTPPQRAIWVPAYIEHDIRTVSAVSLRTLYLRCDNEDLLPHRCRALEVSGLFRELILRLVATQSRQVEAVSQVEMLSLLLRELHAAPDMPLNVPMPSDARLVRLCNAVMADLGNDSDLEKLCSRFGLSVRNVSRLFIKDCGMSFGEWRRQCKLLEALVQIAAGRPITAVALGLGYESPSAFTYMFRKVMGVPPTHYFEQGSRTH